MKNYYIRYSIYWLDCYNCINLNTYLYFIHLSHKLFPLIIRQTAPFIERLIYHLFFNVADTIVSLWHLWYTLTLFNNYFYLLILLNLTFWKLLSFLLIVLTIILLLLFVVVTSPIILYNVVIFIIATKSFSNYIVRFKI